MQQHHCSNRSGFPVPFLGFALVLLISLASPASSCTEQEKNSLLQLLAGLSWDGGLKASWRSETDCCTWEGITCRGPARTVTNVSLASRGLEGSISPFLGNLTGLLHLNLSCNLLSGGLPLELVSSSSIIVLDVSFNRLTGGLSELPSSTPARPLQVLNISSNLLTGSFPSTIWEAMKSLVALNASTNSFTGQIPTTPCVSAPSFAVLELSFNLFSGNIPPGLSNCSVLKLLSAGYNHLSGTLPDELFKVTSLEHLSLPSNWLEGALNGISKLTSLVTLDLGKNGLIGNIPDSIGELKRLEELHLDSNNMSGELPSTLSDCTNLITIDLKSNNFSGELTKVNFSGLSNLKNLDLNYNNFTGSIPESIYSCSKLTALRLSNNHFHVQLSEEIGNLESLSFLSLVKTSLTNTTRTLQILRGCRNLTTLLIGFNFMHETMPEDDSIGGFENLQVFAMNDCSLSGQIPHWLSKLTNLGMIFLHNNQLAGTIPDWISSLNFLFYLDVANNSLTGEIPTALMDMQMLESDKIAPKVFELPVYYKSQFIQYLMPSAFPKVLNLGVNNFTGLIPEKIGQLKALISLNLSSNRLYGEIPQSICNLTNLQVLDLSVNHLTGAIPAALNNLHFLSQFNISSNDLEGPIPTVGQLSTFPNSSYEGNPKLCGSMLVNHCGSAETPLIAQKRRKKKGVLALAFGVFCGGVAILFLLALLVLFRGRSFMTKKRSRNNDDIEDTSSNFNSEYSLVMVPLGMGEQNKLKLTDLLKATKNFDKDHIIGCGGYGLVYKAELPDGSKVAIKKLSSEMCLMEREFSAEVDALSMAQHDNLVPFWGYCIQGSSRLLIYSYMENGSLDDWLHNREDDAGSFLDWPMRLKIAQGASQGLSYIHNVCKPHIVHRDIKSSNILLDKEFKAYVADFGLSRLIFPNNTHVTTELVGTLGYIPPEYGQEWVATLRGDMYSFGVVLLELVTGRRPVQICPKSKELVQWVQEMRSKGKQIEVLDPTLRGTGYEEQMLEVLEAACQCVDRNPGMRPTIQDVVSFFNSVGVNLQKQNSVSIQCK